MDVCGDRGSDSCHGGTVHIRSGAQQQVGQIVFKEAAESVQQCYRIFPAGVSDKRAVLESVHVLGSVI